MERRDGKAEVAEVEVEVVETSDMMCFAECE